MCMCKFICLYVCIECQVNSAALQRAVICCCIEFFLVNDAEAWSRYYVEVEPWGALAQSAIGLELSNRYQQICYWSQWNIIWRRGGKINTASYHYILCGIVSIHGRQMSVVYYVNCKYECLLFCTRALCMMCQSVCLLGIKFIEVILMIMVGIDLELFIYAT